MGDRGRIPVTGTLNGVPIRTSVFPTGEGGHFMLINKQMQNHAKAGAGDRVEVVLELDESPRVLELPDDLDKALSKSPSARKAFEGLSYSHRRQYLAWIEGAKRPETRTRRIEQMLSRVLGES